MRLTILLTLLVFGPVSWHATAAEPPWAPSVPSTPSTSSANRTLVRVRTADGRIAKALAAGIERSAAFREVLGRVEQLDVIAYAEMDPGLRDRLSGAVRWVAATKQFRYVRIVLNPSLPHSQLVSTLAHELQHVAEIGNEQSVVDERSLSSFYVRVGTEHGFNTGEWETKLAQETGFIVRREFAAARADTRGF